VLGQGKNTDPFGSGSGQVPKALDPIDLGTGRKASAISVSGGNSACALLDQGEVKCWGNNQYGQLGTGDTADHGDGHGAMGNALLPIALGRKALSVSAGSDYTCAVLDNGTVKCWGSARFGQLGGDTPYDALLPVQFVTVILRRPATAVSASNGVTCALLDNGTLECWGDVQYVPDSLSDSANLDGSDGIGDSNGEMSKLLALTFNNVKAASIVAGEVSEAILQDGSLMLWGFGYQGWTNAGLPPNDFASVSAMKMGTGRKVISSDADVYHACAVTNDGALSCWGFAPNGALGLGSQVSSPGPVKYSSNGAEIGTISVDLGGKAAVQVAVGEQHTCVLLADHSLKCWGYNIDGQLGLGDRDSRGNTGDKLSADTTVDLSF
jgi:alpha-tubulin suppressor-like RCC1 family protein